MSAPDGRDGAAPRPRELQDGAAPRPRELRIALAMRGGVSLAVWIGGACAEITRLRSEQGDDGFWRPLLAAAGYDGVRIDVLAGASAGGLNGTLLAASLLYGVPFDAYRDVWLDVADLGALLRDPNDRRPISVLRGDDYFLAQLEQRLGELVAARPARAELAGEYLDLHLTATLFAPTAVPVLDDWAGRYEEASHRAGFRFRHNRFTSDFRHDGDPAEENAAAVAKLALAARATSSFPGAFEPATVRVSRPAHVGARAALAHRDDFFGLFSDASRPVHRVIDGGVLNNIPVARAVEAIATSSARGPTERWLLYLHPSPDEPPAESSRADAEPDTIRTVLAASSARGSAESVLDDLDLLRAHNALVDRYRVTRQALLSGLVGGDGSGLLEAAAQRSADYWALRVERVAHRVRALLEDPVRVLGEDPFTSPDERWPLAASGAQWSVADRAALEAALLSGLRRRTAAIASGLPAGAEQLSALGAEPLPRLAHVCLETVWRLERAGSDPEALATVKQRLYAVADTADLLVHIGDLFWPVYAARRPPERRGLDTWADTALDVGMRLTADPDAVPASAPDVLSPLAVLRAELRRRSGPLPAVAAALPDVCWHELVRCCVTLAALTRDAGPVAGEEGETAGVPAELLQRIGSADHEAGRVLAAVEVLTFPLQTLGPKPPQPIRFLRVAGSRRSPLERHFPGGRLTVGDKLAGNELMNFAAFYKRSWRANDWLWGRLDAAATLVDLLVQPETLRRTFGSTAAGADPARPDDDPSARLIDFVRRQVCRPLENRPPLGPAEQQAWQAHFADLWEEHAAAVTAEAQALFAGATGEDLGVARELLVSRRQWELLLDELPVVLRAVAEDGDRAARRGRRARGREGAEPPRTPQALLAVLGDYRVGRETIADDIGTPRFVRLAGDLAVVTWNAVAAGLGGAARPLRPVGWVLRLLRRSARVAVALPAWLRAPAMLARRLSRAGR